MEIPLWAIQFLSGGMGGLVPGIVGVTKAQTFNPDTFKFRVYPEFYEGEIFCHYSYSFNDCWSNGGFDCQCRLADVSSYRLRW